MLLLLLLADGVLNLDGNNWWFTAITAVVNLGFAVVVGIYLLTKAIPKMQDDNSKLMTKIQEDNSKLMEKIQQEHTRELAAQRTEFLAELKIKREESRQDEKDRRGEFKEALKLIADHCEREGERRDNVLQVELAGVSRATEDQSRIMEEVRTLLVQLNNSRK